MVPLITTDFALEQGRDVAIQEISARKRYQNKLIKDGAKVITNTGDILMN